MNIVYMGTPDFAVPPLKSLINNGYNIVGVFTQPDKKVGRKQILTPSPVKSVAIEFNIPVYQPTTLKNSEIYELIKELNPDIIVVVAYGKIIPLNILEFPKYGCINVHASLLPKYRGAAPIQWAVLNGDKETGVCTMQMNEGIDTGDILLVEKTTIGINETSEELFDRLSISSAEILVKTMKQIEENKIIPTPQPQGNYEYASMISKENSPIDWNKSAFEIHNKIRGLQSWPCAETTLYGKKIKIHKSVLNNSECNYEPGKIVNNKNVLTVACGDGKCIDILEVQPEGKKKMDIKAFLAGNKTEIGLILE